MCCRQQLPGKFDTEFHFEGIYHFTVNASFPQLNSPWTQIVFSFDVFNAWVSLGQGKCRFFFWQKRNMCCLDVLFVCVQDAPVITVRAQRPPASPSSSGSSGTVILPAILKTCNPDQPMEPTIMDRWLVHFVCIMFMLIYCAIHHKK